MKLVSSLTLLSAAALIVCAEDKPQTTDKKPAVDTKNDKTEKVVKTVSLHGNTSAASIPLALDVAVRDGRIKPGHVVMIEAVGGGFTWGAAIIRW